MTNEIKIISTILTDKAILIEHIDLFNPIYFKQHKEVAEVILELLNNGNEIDFDSLQHKLPTLDVYQFTETVNSFVVDELLNELKEDFYKMELLKLAALINSKKDENAYELNITVSKELERLNSILITNKKEKTIDIIRDVIKEIELAKSQKGITGIQTGFDSLDKVTGGWQNGNLIILAARPAMGKTSLALCQAINAATSFGKNVYFASLEMSTRELMKREISLLTEIPLANLKNDKPIDFSLIHAKVPQLESGVKIVDNLFKLKDLQNFFRVENSKQKIDCIFIDYLQLIGGDKSGSREQEVSGISRDLKLLAKELSCPIIALSQLSRGVESRGAKRPMLSDLRDSGAIEQDADIVNFIYRPEYYGITEDENGDSTFRVAEIDFAKNRNGSIGIVKLSFNDTLTKFTDPNMFVETEKDDFPKMQPNEDF